MGIADVNLAGPQRSLSAFYDPQSVAVVGVSDKPGKWGHEIARRVIGGQSNRRIHLVSSRSFSIGGHSTKQSLTHVEDGVELVIAAVSAESFEAVVDDGLSVGARAFIGVSGGMGELGGAALQRQHDLVDRIRANGARLLGPNCLGVMDTHSRFIATAWFQSPAERQGSVAVITQSGTVGLDFERLTRGIGLGFSRFVSVGNQADVQIAELLEDLVDHEPTRLVVVYCESLGDGRRLFRAAQALVERGKPVLMLAPGASQAAALAAQSHTGAMTSTREVVKAACRASGVQLFETTAELVDTAYFSLKTSRLAGRRVVVVADGGGYGVLTADLLDARGFEVPTLSPDTQAALVATLGEGATTTNPIDLAAAAGDPAALDRAVNAVIRSGEADSVVVTGFIGDPSDTPPERKQVIVSPETARHAESNGVAVVVQTLFDDSQAVRDLRDLPVATYRTATSVANVYAAAVLGPGSGIPRVPAPLRRQISPGYFGARNLLIDAGISFASSQPADRDPDTVLHAAAALKYPLVLKATDHLHKSEGGGVVLGITGQEELLRAHAGLVERGGYRHFAVEEMAQLSSGTELIIGARNDPQMGPLGLIGLGGIHAEIFGDNTIMLAPLTKADALRAIRGLRGAGLLLGARGRPPLDIESAADVLVSVSSLVAENPHISELEINPVLVTPTAAIGLDARVIMSTASH